MRRLTVLLVDDDPDQHHTCGAFLRHQGFDVLHAHDGAEGLSVALSALPDVIVTDLRMPRMSGGALLDALGADPRTVAIPVVILTADVVGARGNAAARARAAAYLEKPCELRVVLEVVRGLVKG